MGKKFFFRTGEINIPTFDYKITVVVTNNITKAAARIRGVDLEEDEEKFYNMCQALTLHWPEEGESYILIPPKVDVGDIAHESWHVIRAIFKRVHAKLENEMVAYHLGYLTNHVYDIWKRKRK